MKQVAAVGWDNHMDEIFGRDPNGRSCSFPQDEHLHSLFPNSSSAAMGCKEERSSHCLF